MNTFLRKTAPAALVFALAIGLSGQSKDTTAIVGMENARKTALASSNGKIKSEELEKEHGKQIYSFDIAMPNGLHEVNVDAVTGKLIDDKVESAADEAKEAAQDKKEAARKAKKKAEASKPDAK